MFSLKSPHRGDSNKYTQYTIFNIKMKITLNCPKSAAKGCFAKGLQNEFETAVVNGPSVLEPLKVYCSNSNLDLDLTIFKLKFVEATINFNIEYGNTKIGQKLRVLVG